jgi:DNA invertase Pin-like site-specific DNA recombinase
VSEDKKVNRLSNGLQSIDLDKDEHINESVSKDEIRERYSKKRDMSKVIFIPPRQELDLVNPRSRKRVVVYCRVSTDGISQTTSFELQKNYYLKYVRRRPEWKLVGLYSDEGITATSMDKRVGLLTMLDDARAGKFDIIVVKNLSRLNRNLMDCMNIIYELRSLPRPVGILFETENMFTLDKNVDFTLQVLSLVAQEESHKKSEAMTSSYQQRFGTGQYTKPDLLGYDSVGINEIAINEEEAKTVQLTFMMYLAGFTTKAIAGVLMMLGRKTHTHKYKDGRVKEGKVKWTASSVLSILKNERRCGDVLAQKTYTPNYLDHKSKRNDKVLPQYYAKDQHPPIVAREDYELVQKIIKVNRGGWKGKLPHLGIYNNGLLSGFVSSVPGWLGFTAEDYNRASLHAFGISEKELDNLEKNIESKKQEKYKDVAAMNDFQHSLQIDSDDYEMFPEVENVKEEVGTKEEELSFRSLMASCHNIGKNTLFRKSISKYNLSDCEVAKSELFTLQKKVVFTLDDKGVYFNKMSFNKIADSDIGDIEYVDMAYNPIEKVLLVKLAQEESDTTIHWSSEKDGCHNMRHCSCKGIAQAVYTNMGWNQDFKYRIVGSSFAKGSERYLVFCLDEPLTIVPARAGMIKNIDTEKVDEEETRKIIRSGYLPEHSFVPDLTDFQLGDGTMANAAKKMSRSRAIYYDELTEKSNGELHVDDLGDKKYSPECIQRLIQKGITPKEGWLYLKGMAIIRPASFTIYPEELAEKFGPDIYHSKEILFRALNQNTEIDSTPKPYGWTVGLDLPSIKTVRETINTLKSEMN